MYSSSLFTSARAILGVLPAATLIKMSLAVAGKLPYVVVVSVQATLIIIGPRTWWALRCRSL